MKIAIYLSGVPKVKNELKVKVLKNFGLGVEQCKDRVEFVTDYKVVKSDVAVIQGFISQDITTPHLKLRKDVLDANTRTVIIDSNLFQFANPPLANYYLRYSLNGVFPTTGFYFDNNIDQSRWPSISQKLNISLKNYRDNGDHILICLQRKLGWSLQSTNLQDWLNQTISKIRETSSRKIIVRKHPGDRLQAEIKLQGKNVFFSENQYIVDDLQNAWACVTFNSSPGVASLINGIPVFVTDTTPQNSQTYPVCNTNLSDIETPATPDRLEWLHRISQSHWNDDEIISGLAWKFMRDRIMQI